jgi:uncharacterized protein
MSQIQLLYQLQQFDTEIREKKQRLGDVLRAQKETEALLAARARANTAEAEWQTWQTRRKTLNLELESVNDKARRSESRLYSGNVRNPKELSDLQHEIEALGRRRAALEDDILEAMIMLEEAEGEKTAADEALESITADWEKAQAQLKREQNELALRLHQLTGLRQQPLALLTAASLAEYDQIGRRKGGVAVVGLKQTMCLGCRLTISATKAREAQEGKLVHCGSCGRILYPL